MVSIVVSIQAVFLPFSAPSLAGQIARNVLFFQQLAGLEAVTSAA